MEFNEENEADLRFKSSAGLLGGSVTPISVFIGIIVVFDDSS